MTSHAALAEFIDRLDLLVATDTDPYSIANSTGLHLSALLRQPDFLEERFARAEEDSYAQHVIHVHPEGKYSIVSLVWLPGQSTAIHDHICWCVVGVLRGREHEVSYNLHGADERHWLTVSNEQSHSPGDICCLVPPLNDIHRVHNSTDGLSISIHVYGADIAARGTSIYRTYECEIRSLALGADA